jgi:predicted SAM-dependent methyltransferase
VEWLAVGVLKNGDVMKIHAGCGKRILEGWTNVDVQRIPGAARDPDLLCDLRSVPLPDACAEELMAIHVAEHFYPWELKDEVLPEWKRLLKPGGKLVLEMPDVMKAARNLLAGAGDQMAMWPLYGDNTLRDPYMMHKWGWCYATIKPVLEAAGFQKVKERDPQYHGARLTRDFRVEALA